MSLFFFYFNLFYDEVTLWPISHAVKMFSGKMLTTKMDMPDFIASFLPGALKLIRNQHTSPKEEFNSTY